MRRFYIMLSEQFGQRVVGKRSELLMLMTQAFPDCYFEVGVGRPADDYIDDFGDVTIAPVASQIGMGFSALELPEHVSGELFDMQRTVLAFADGRRLVMN